MLERTGDLIPVLPRAAGIPWTRRRSQVGVDLMFFLIFLIFLKFLIIIPILPPRF